MTGTRVTLMILVALVAMPNVARADDDGPRSRRPRLLDAARIRQLADILRSDPDERRRSAAVKELGNADPRVHPEVMPALIAALQRDAASVRASAAETIGRFRTVFPLAGAALENAAESDSSPAVREAAKQSLWEYHLNGYRSAKGTETFLAQTAEPPIARPERPRPPITGEPSLAPALPTTGVTPPSTSDTLPPVGSPPGPRVSRLSGMPGLRTLLSGRRHAGATSEPPLARAKHPPVPTLKLTQEPPILPRWPEPVVIGRSPSYSLELPPIVSPPDGK